MSEHETSSGSRDSDSGEERNGPGEQGPTRMLGDLEARVMQVVWAADKAVSVREMREHVGPELHRECCPVVLEPPPLSRTPLGYQVVLVQPSGRTG
jgi:hypothetical protein